MICEDKHSAHFVIFNHKAVALHAKHAQRGGRGIAPPYWTLALDRSGVVSARPQPVYRHGKRAGTHFTGGRMGLGEQPGWGRKISPHRVWNPGLPSSYRVAIPTTLSRPCHIYNAYVCIYIYTHRVEPDYNDIGLSDTSYITSYVLWYQFIPYC
jgi:hypothetical protein